MHYLIITVVAEHFDNFVASQPPQAINLARGVVHQTSRYFVALGVAAENDISSIEPPFNRHYPDSEQAAARFA